MHSPFPGMNPYLEHPDVWHDFHERFIPRLADLLNAQVGANYLVKIDEHVYVHEVDEEARRFIGRADVAIAQHSPASRTGASAALLEAPAQVVPLLLVDEVRESFVEIRDRHNRALVTVVELLSPANKTGSDRQQYLSKRHQILKSSAHLVEIDLLRGGTRMPFEKLPECDYCVMVSREENRPPAGFWPLRLREPLPSIPVPLKPGDDDASVDLQQLVHQIHDAAGYAKYIYENEITPPLSQADAQWAAAIATAARAKSR
jgi:hypothetical protein